MRTITREPSVRLLQVACALSLFGALTACDKIKDKLGLNKDLSPDAAVVAEADADVDAATAMPAPTDTPALPSSAALSAANVNDIARFPDETALEDVAVETKRSASVREAPQTGRVIVSLPSGSKLTEVAQRETYFLVVFDDPKDSSKKLLGWIHQDAFSPAPAKAAVIASLTCKSGQVTLYSDAAFCGTTCTKDADCPSGQACKGSAQTLKSGHPDKTVTVCSAVKTDAGAKVVTTTTSDAGATAHAGDAGTTVHRGVHIKPLGGAIPKTLFRPKTTKKK